MSSEQVTDARNHLLSVMRDGEGWSSEDAEAFVRLTDTIISTESVTEMLVAYRAIDLLLDRYELAHKCLRCLRGRDQASEHHRLKSNPASWLCEDCANEPDWVELLSKPDPEPTVAGDDPHANDPVTVTFTHAEAGIVRSVLGAHRHTLTRRQRNAERKRDRLGDEFVAERTAHNERDSSLTASAYRKVKRALWGKDA